MDKKSKLRWRLKQLRIRSKVFLRRNGLQVAVIAALALMGGAALMIFSENRETPNEQVNNSGDQTLDNAIQNGNATIKPTDDPNISVTPRPTGRPEMPSDEPTLLPSTTPAANPAGSPNPTHIPDFTPVPNVTLTPEPESRYQPPVDGSIIRIFAINSLIYSETLNQWMTHSGVDIAGSKGSEVRSIAEGTVENVYNDDMLGMTVVISHANGCVSMYSNLDEDVDVSIGDTVRSRQVIGRIGATAISECLERSHLHFELHINGEPVNPEGLILFNKEQE